MAGAMNIIASGKAAGTLSIDPALAGATSTWAAALSPWAWTCCCS